MIQEPGKGSFLKNKAKVLNMQNFFSILCLFCLFFSIGPAILVAPQSVCAQSEPGVLRLGVHVAGIGSLDPHLTSGSQDRILADMLFNGLLRYKPGLAPKLEPDLARDFPRYQLKNGRQVWTVNLRKGVLFHPGHGLEPYELTAEDVVFSLRKAADPGRSKYSGEYTGMRFLTIDDHTLEIILEQPLSPTLFFPKIADYSGGLIVSKRAIEASGHECFADYPVGTGPFRFSEHLKGEKVVLSAHQGYFRGRPKLKGVEVHFLPSFLEREAALKAGRVDVSAATADPGRVDRLISGIGFVLDIHGVGEVLVIHLNTKHEPFTDLRVRKAILRALDRKEFLKSCHPLLVQKSLAPVPGELLPGGMKNSKVRSLGLDYEADLERARALLAEAGYPDGFKVSVIASEKRLYRRLYTILKRQLAQVKIQCRVTVVPHSEMLRRIRNNESDIVIYGAWRPTVDTYLTRFYHSDSIVLTGKNPDTNFSHYHGVDPLIEAARLEISPEKQEQLWAHAQIRILSEAAAYPLFFIKQFFLRTQFVDYGHPVRASLALYPQVTEKTDISK